MHRTHFPGRSAGCLVLAAVLLGGCGGGDGDSAADSASANPPTSSGNSAPAISGAPGSTVVVGQAYGFQPAASDANGDSLTFTVANLPAWATFSTATGRISGTPTASDVGAYADIRITVSDGMASASLAPFTLNVSQTGTGSATLSWTPPTQNTDGGTLSNLSGYEVRYGQSASDLGQVVTLANPSINRYVIENLGSGTWYFAVVAVNSAGVTSSLSNMASKTIG